MTKEIMIQRVSILYPKFKQFFKTGTFRPTMDEIKSITELARELNPKLPLVLNTGCGSCMRDAIKALANWYDKLSSEEIDSALNPPKEETENPATTEPTTPEDTPNVEETTTQEAQTQTLSVETTSTTKKTRKSNKIYSEDINQTT